jgi:Rrf2 family protein
VLLSRACEYAVHVVLVLAAEEDEGFVPVRRLADRCRIPHHFLAKICGELTQGGVLHSRKGPNGGVALARAASRINLLDVVRAINGLGVFDRCVLGLEPCSGDLPCPVHDDWVRIKHGIRDMLARKNLRELTDELTSRKIVLAKTGAGGSRSGAVII